MAKYPELAQKIKGIPAKNQSAIYRLAVFSNDDTDDIPVFEFYHRQTESMPEGRSSHARSWTRPSLKSRLQRAVQPHPWRSRSTVPWKLQT